MRRVLITLAVILLMLAGAVIDRVVTPLLESAPAAAARTTTATHTTAPTGTSAAPAQSSRSLSTTSPTAIDAAIQHAYNIAAPSVVYVDNVGTGTGSGVIYDSSGDIVTNFHVVQGAKTLRVTLGDGRTLPATIRGTDSADDLAIIHVSASGLPAAHFATAVSPATVVLAIGNPLGLKQSVTMGLVSGLDRVEQEPSGAYLPNAIQTSAPINPGNSGGALVALDGSVVGIPTMVQTSSGDGAPAQNVGFAIPADRVTKVAGEIVATGKVTHTGRAYLGVSAGDPTSGSGFGQGNWFSPFGGPNGGNSTPGVEGAVVQSVGSNSPAGHSGVQVGDVITRFNSTRISSADDLLTALAGARPGQTATITVNRNGSTRTLTVTLGELPANQ